MHPCPAFNTPGERVAYCMEMGRAVELPVLLVITKQSPGKTITWIRLLLYCSDMVTAFQPEAMPEMQAPTTKQM